MKCSATYRRESTCDKGYHMKVSQACFRNVAPHKCDAFQVARRAAATLATLPAFSAMGSAVGDLFDFKSTPLFPTNHPPDGSAAHAAATARDGVEDALDRAGNVTWGGACVLLEGNVTWGGAWVLLEGETSRGRCVGAARGGNVTWGGAWVLLEGAP
jgi:hypothetical protein